MRGALKNVHAITAERASAGPGETTGEARSKWFIGRDTLPQVFEDYG